jgi:hypothetical protein
MKIRSTNKLPYKVGREGIKNSIIEIEQKIVNRDSVNKVYTISSTDYSINEESTSTTPTSTPMYPGMGKEYISSITISKTYQEYDEEVARFTALDDSGLTGSGLEDKILRDIFLDSAVKGKFYTSALWASYEDEVI